MMRAVEQRYGHDEAVEVGRAIFTGIGWIAAERLTRALGVDPSEAGTWPRCSPSPTSCSRPTTSASAWSSTPATTIRLSGNAAGLSEGDPYSLPGLLVEGADGIVESLVHGVDPTATVVTHGRGVDRAWTVPRSAAPRRRRTSPTPSSSLASAPASRSRCDGGCLAPTTQGCCLTGVRDSAADRPRRRVSATMVTAAVPGAP